MLIGVCPPREQVKRERLFAALEKVFPARFEARRPGEHRGLDALIVLGDESLIPVGGPRRLVMRQQDGSAPLPGLVRFAASPLLDRRLRGWACEDARAGGLVDCANEGEADRVVASCGRSALWVRSTCVEGVDRAALAPEELDGDELLRDALVPGRWLALLPLVHFLREVCAELAWTPPPLRAAFIFDDPNLHWPSYGHIRFAELAEHGDKHGYHVAFATIPLDSWFVHKRAARLFRERPDVLSLLAHGNDHVRAELTRPRPEDEAMSMLAQAHRRLAELERRSGVEVSRLMVAPFGLCSPELMRALLRAGFDGLCHSWPVSRTRDRILAGWEIADVVEGGFPVFSRQPLTTPSNELVWRSYLDQPLILYGHHGDVAGGLDILSERAADVGHFGDVQWASPARIARTSFLMRSEGATLRVRPYSRNFAVDLPDGVERVVVELPHSHGEPERESALLEAGSVRASTRFENAIARPFETHGAARVEVRLVRDDAVDVASTPSPRRQVFPILRRLGTEARDRLLPRVRSAA